MVSGQLGNAGYSVGSRLPTCRCVSHSYENRYAKRATELAGGILQPCYDAGIFGWNAREYSVDGRHQH